MVWGDREAGDGRKDDSHKLRWDLLPAGPLTDIVGVLTFGARKYAPDNWQKVPSPSKRYFAAAQRHLWAWKDGEVFDPESGLPHLAHAGCCLLFLAWFDAKPTPTCQHCDDTGGDMGFACVRGCGDPFRTEEG